MDRSQVPAPTSRARRGRWLGGVCAGLAARSHRPVARYRAAFALASLFFGLGALVYLAAWLILPAEGEDGGGSRPRGIVTLAQGCAALTGLATLALAAGLATVFGFGGIIVAIVAAILLGTLVTWPRVGPAWALLPIGALVLPAVAVASTGMRIEPRTSTLSLAPRTAAELPSAPIRNGLGLIEIDLRQTALPSSGTIPLRIDAGVRRALIALPSDRCVRVEVRQRDLPVTSRAVQAMFGRPSQLTAGGVQASTPGAAVFGETYYDPRIRAPEADRLRRGPTLAVDFSSDGGTLTVRDYPDRIEPSWQPDWPGYTVFVEERPNTEHLSRGQARRMIRSWRDRVAAQKRSQRRIARLQPGPCARPRKEDRR